MIINYYYTKINITIGKDYTLQRFEEINLIFTNIVVKRIIKNKPI